MLKATLIGSRSKNMESRHDLTGTPQAAGESPSPDANRKVVLSVEVAAAPLSVREILQLRAGSTLHFPQTADAPITWRLDRTPAGRGIAVRAGSRLGLRICERFDSRTEPE